MGNWCIPIIATVGLWIWLNPRLFSIPKHTDNWASKVTFGERIWLDRSQLAIPEHHKVWAVSLSVTAGIGFFIAVVSAYQNLIWSTLLGGTISWFGKMWFCDRMVWLYHDMRDVDSEYSRWLK